MTVATIDGCTILGTRAATWALTSGVQPHAASFDVLRADADALVAQGLKPVTLDIDGVQFKNVYVTQALASENPNWATVRVVDRRHFWNMRQYRAGFNVRRRVGFKRLSDPNNLVDVGQIAPEIAYVPWSLKASSQAGQNGSPWTAPDVVRDIFKRCAEAEQDATGKAPSLTITGGALAKFSSLPIESLFVASDAATCLATALDFLPGTGVYIDANGDAIVYDRSGGEEAGVVQSAQPEKVGRGHVERISLANVRPSEIRVLFCREIEVRFNYAELERGDTTVIPPDTRYMENVLPVPDFSLSVGGTNVPRGTWITVQQALTAWGNAPGLGRKLELKDLRRAAIPFNGLWTVLQLVGTKDPDRDWAGRIAALQKHYRRTYRINRRWMDRIFRLKAARVALLDPANRINGKATVFSDYAYLATRRSLAQQFLSGANDGTYAINVAAFDGGNLTSTTYPAPFDVSVVDEDQGIIEFAPVSDPYRVSEQILPSQVEMDGDNTRAGQKVANPGPTGDPVLASRATGRSIMFNSLGRNQKVMQLTGNYVCSVILTAQPALGFWANQKNQFTTITLKPTDVRDFAGRGACKGPPLEILIGGGIETARVAWTDDHSQEVEAAFGLGVSPFSLDPRTVNLGSSGKSWDSINGASLDHIARAAAERLWHSLADRYHGSMMGGIVASAAPAGWLGEVGFGLEPTGETWTRLNLPDRAEPFSLESYLDATTRRILLRLASPAA